MKKLLAFLAFLGIFCLNSFAEGVSNLDQDATLDADSIEQVEEPEIAPAPEVPAAAPVAEAAPAAEPVETGLHQQLKQKFIEGGAGFMGIVVLCLILGLALAIERIIYLNLATTNTDKLLANIEDALNEGGVDSALEVCRSTRGPVASIFYQGLSRHEEGIDMVEKSVVSYGSVQMGLLEKGLTWISLFIALAPMLGFMGTVIGMIQAFDSIEAAGDISPSLVAGGIKVALITTVTGLIVAMILQVFYNYLLAKIDSLVNTMEDASISLIDILAKYNLAK
jgi:biopolymer transport protein ExbB